MSGIFDDEDEYDIIDEELEDELMLGDDDEDYY